MAQDKSAGRRERRAKRHRRVLKKIRGTAERPRLVVFRSLRNIEGQLVDDDRGATLLGVSSLGVDDPRDAEEGMTAKIASAYAAGRVLGEKARKAGIDSIVFDRGGYRFHGRVRAFAEGARAGGLKF